MAEWYAEFTRLKAWQVAYNVGIEIYNRACAFPHPHLFSLGSQLQRAAISLPTNIAEGFGRRRSRDKAHFYSISHASGDELKCLLFSLGMEASSSRSTSKPSCGASMRRAGWSSA